MIVQTQVPITKCITIYGIEHTLYGIECFKDQSFVNCVTILSPVLRYKNTVFPWADITSAHLS